jgi:hypothetical protein
VDDGFTVLRESWRGASYDDVVRAWGPPSQSAKDSHSWLTEQRAPGGAGGMVFGAAGTPAGCDRTLVFRDDRVVDARWTGDPGYCQRYLRRR